MYRFVLVTKYSSYRSSNDCGDEYDRNHQTNGNSSSQATKPLLTCIRRYGCNLLILCIHCLLRWVEAMLRDVVLAVVHFWEVGIACCWNGFRIHFCVAFCGLRESD
jgi:hypothetical protein